MISFVKYKTGLGSRLDLTDGVALTIEVLATGSLQVRGFDADGMLKLDLDLGPGETEAIIDAVIAVGTSLIQLKPIPRIDVTARPGCQSYVMPVAGGRLQLGNLPVHTDSMTFIDLEPEDALELAAGMAAALTVLKSLLILLESEVG